MMSAQAEGLIEGIEEHHEQEWGRDNIFVRIYRHEGLTCRIYCAFEQIS